MSQVIAALASAPGEGAIGVIEVFGHGAVEMIDQVFESPSKRRLNDSSPCDLFYGTIAANGQPVDEVLVRVASRNPDRLDINCHGGPAPHTAVMLLLEELGARRCEWHELAELAGKAEALDLIQIEAIQKVPGALTLAASMMLITQYNGALSKAVSDADLTGRRDELLSLAPYGIALCNPPKLVIAGRPNVGKSTLANVLMGKKRVIESPVAGTTRDAVADHAAIGDVPFELTDTAGIGGSDGELGKLAEQRAIVTVEKADIVLCVLDGSTPAPKGNVQALPRCPSGRTIWVINKNDLRQESSVQELAEEQGGPIVAISAANRTGIDDLKRTVLATLFPSVPEDVTRAIPFTHRQAELLERLDGSNASAIVDELLRSSICS